MSLKTTFISILHRLLDWVTPSFSVEAKMRANASNWLELAEKIFHYRRDELGAQDLADLQQKRESLHNLVRDRADASRLKLGIEALEGVLRRTGGKIYPRSTILEYVEFFVVAAILVIGVRVYFVQPFKIPTNSMWPSYNGMTPYVYQDPAAAPGPVMKLVRLLAFGAVHKEVIAPVDGKIAVPIFVNADGRLFFEKKPGRKWWIFPAVVREYIIYVGDEPVRFQVPEDFDFDWAFRDAFGYTKSQLDDLARKSKNSDYRQFRWVVLGRDAVKGQPLISFDILTGDNLFVDRISYHFVRPKVGDGFVFRTGNIPGIGQDQYYIKRLVGVPGDEMEIQPPFLMRNGAPITGARAFVCNQKRERQYQGYFNGSLMDGSTMLLAGEKITVPPDGYLALGDNSGNSRDGRYWGYVPRKDVVGRPIFVYYPLTQHWGVSR